MVLCKVEPWVEQQFFFCGCSFIIVGMKGKNKEKRKKRIKRPLR